MEIKIINEPYYMREACDCCEGWWWDSYKIEVDGVYETVANKDAEWDVDTNLEFGDLDYAIEYVKENFPLQFYTVIDRGCDDNNDYVDYEGER